MPPSFSGLSKYASVAIPGSTVTYEAGGSDDQSTTWSGSGTISLDEDEKFTDPANTTGGFDASMTLDPPTKKMVINLRLHKSEAFTITYKEGPSGKGDVGDPDAPIEPTMTKAWIWMPCACAASMR